MPIYGVSPKQVENALNLSGKIIVSTVQADVPAIPAAGQTYLYLAVQGAKVGGVAVVNTETYLRSWVVNALVSGANQVRVEITNNQALASAQELAKDFYVSVINP